MFTNKAMQLTPARFKSLKYSFGIATSHTAQNQAVKLAPTVKAFRPGVYQVGACICDLWRMSCTCKTARANKAKNISQQSKPCPHFVALFLAGEWLPIDPDPMLYNKSVGIEQPEIIAVYARLNHWKGRKAHVIARIESTGFPGVILATLPDGATSYEHKNAVSHIMPFYE